MLPHSHVRQPHIFELYRWKRCLPSSTYMSSLANVVVIDRFERVSFLQPLTISLYYPYIAVVLLGIQAHYVQTVVWKILFIYEFCFESFWTHFSFYNICDLWILQHTMLESNEWEKAARSTGNSQTVNRKSPKGASNIYQRISTDLETTCVCTSKHLFW